MKQNNNTFIVPEEREIQQSAEERQFNSKTCNIFSSETILFGHNLTITKYNHN